MSGRGPKNARAWGALLLATYVGLRVFLETRYELFDPDEALEMLAATSLREGHLPYLGALSHRGPFLTVLYAIPCTLFGPSAYHAVHAFAILLFVGLGLWFQRAVARATTERVGLLALGALVLLGSLRIPTEDNWSLNSDFLMGAWLTAGMCPLLVAEGATSTRATWPVRRVYFTAGICLALAFLTKQNAAPVCVVPIAYVAVVDRTHLLAKLAAFIGGLVLPLALAATTYLAVGELPRAWYFFYEYNRDYAVAAFTGGLGSTLWLDARWFGRSYGELFVLAAAGAVVATKTPSMRRGVWLLAVAWTLGGLAAAASPGKHWDNYLWASHAPVALLAALGADSLLDFTDHRPAFARRAKVAMVLGLPILVCLTRLGGARDMLATATEVGGIPPPHVPRRVLVDVIDRVTSEADTLYVTGYAPELYVLAARRPASRHVISNFVEAVYPGRFAEPSHIVPRFFRELRADLQANAPRVIVDACALGFLCHPSSALTAALPVLLRDYHPVPGGPVGLFVRNE